MVPRNSAGADKTRPHLCLAGLALDLLVEPEQQLVAVVGGEAEHAQLVREVSFREDEEHIPL